MHNNKTYHLWTKQFSFETQKTILKIKKLIARKLYKKNFFDKINHEILMLNDMDEYYQSAPNNNVGSDRVFITPHLDGFLGWIPFMRTWRCIYGLNGPHQTVTKIPFLTDDNIIVSNNSFYCFDYNRDLHWVYQNNSIPIINSRRILKLHFFDYPRWLTFLSENYANINIKYNTFARNQFLFSQNPYKNTSTYIISSVINIITIVGGSIEQYYGFVNLFVILLLIINNNLTDRLLFLKTAMIFVFISSKLIETTKSQLIRDTTSYFLAIVGVLTFYKIKKINCKVYLPISYLIIHLGIVIYTMIPKISQETYYNDLVLFQEYHKNRYNQLIHLITTSYGTMGIIKWIHQYLYISYINLWCFLFLYTRYLIPDIDSENITLIVISFYIILLKKYPKKFKNPLQMIFISILSQELSHYIFNEKTYMSNYITNYNSGELLFKHIIWLIPFEIRTTIN